MELAPEDDKPFNLFYMFNGSEPKHLKPYLDFLYQKLKEEFGSKLARLECIYCDSEALDTYLNDFYVEEYRQALIKLREEEEKRREEEKKRREEEEKRIKAEKTIQLLSKLVKINKSSIDEETLQSLRECGVQL